MSPKGQLARSENPALAGMQAQSIQEALRKEQQQAGGAGGALPYTAPQGDSDSIIEQTFSELENGGISDPAQVLAAFQTRGISPQVLKQYIAKNTHMSDYVAPGNINPVAGLGALMSVLSPPRALREQQRRSRVRTAKSAVGNK